MTGSPEFRAFLISLGRLELDDNQNVQSEAACIEAAQQWREQQRVELRALNALAQRAKRRMPDFTAARQQFSNELNSNLDLQHFLVANPNGPCRLLGQILYFSMESPKQFIIMCRMLQDLT